MKFKDKVFIMQGDQPHINAVGVRLPEFQKLREADKSEDKSQYKKELAYIWHMHEYESPYYDLKNKEEVIIRDCIGRKSWKPTKRVLNALAAYKSLDECAERRALDASVAACDLIADNITNLGTDAKQYNDLIQDIDDAIKETDIVTLKITLYKDKLELKEKQMKISAGVAKMMPQLEATIETTLNLRRKVTTAVFKGESTDTIIGTFLYDDLMTEIDHEEIFGLEE